MNGPRTCPLLPSILNKQQLLFVHASQIQHLLVVAEHHHAAGSDALAGNQSSRRIAADTARTIGDQRWNHICWFILHAKSNLNNSNAPSPPAHIKNRPSLVQATCFRSRMGIRSTCHEKAARSSKPPAPPLSGPLRMKTSPPTSTVINVATGAVGVDLLIERMPATAKRCAPFSSPTIGS